MKLVKYLPLRNSLKIWPLLSRLQKYRNTVTCEATYSKVQGAKSYLQPYEKSPVQLSLLITGQCEALCRHRGLHLLPRQPAISLPDFSLSCRVRRAREAAGIGRVQLSVSLDCGLLTALASFSSRLLLPRTAFIRKSLYCFPKAQIAKGLQVGNPCSRFATSSISSR